MRQQARVLFDGSTQICEQMISSLANEAMAEDLSASMLMQPGAGMANTSLTPSHKSQSNREVASQSAEFRKVLRNATALESQTEGAVVDHAAAGYQRASPMHAAFWRRPQANSPPEPSKSPAAQQLSSRYNSSIRGKFSCLLACRTVHPRWSRRRRSHRRQCGRLLPGEAFHFHLTISPHQHGETIKNAADLLQVCRVFYGAVP